MESPFHFLHLPDELKISILKFFPPRELSRFTRASHHAQSLAEPLLYREPRVEQPSACVTLVQKLSSSAQLAQRVHALHIKYDVKVDLVSEYLHVRLLSLIPNLTKLTIHSPYLDDDEFSVLFEAALLYSPGSLLTKLRECSLYYYDDNGEFQQLGPKSSIIGLPSLERLVLRNIEIAGCEPEMTGPWRGYWPIAQPLRYLALKNCDIATMGLGDLMTARPVIELVISHTHSGYPPIELSPDDFNEWLDALKATSATLEKLSIETYWRGTDQRVSLRHFHKLKKLQIRGERLFGRALAERDTSADIPLEEVLPESLETLLITMYPVKASADYTRGLLCELVQNRQQAAPCLRVIIWRWLSCNDDQRSKTQLGPLEQACQSAGVTLLIRSAVNRYANFGAKENRLCAFQP